MSDRCQSHKCRACSKCAESEPVERTTIAEAIDAWESKGSTSLTVALIADALYGARAEVERLQRQASRFTGRTIAELRAQVERLTVVVDQEARARQHAESEVARLKSYIAAGVGGAS